MKKEELPALFREKTRDACIVIDDSYEHIIAMKDKVVAAAAATKALECLSNIIDTTDQPALAVHALRMVYSYGVNPGLVKETKGDITRRAACIIAKALWVPKKGDAPQDVHETEDVKKAAYIAANNLVLEAESIGCMPAGLILRSCLMNTSKHEKGNSQQLALAAEWAAQHLEMVGDRQLLANFAEGTAQRLMSENKPDNQAAIAYYRDLSHAFMPPSVG